MKTEQYGFSFSDDCGVCGSPRDMRWFDHDLHKFVCDECASDLAFAAASLLGEVEVVEPYRPKMRKA
jgi:hypothetical protein